MEEARPEDTSIVPSVPVSEPMKSTTANSAPAGHQFPELFKAGGALKIKKLKSKKPNSEPKNPVVQLNEIKPGLQYDLIEQKGPVHDPVFVMQLELNGQTFRGQGRLEFKSMFPFFSSLFLLLVCFQNHLPKGHHVSKEQETGFSGSLLISHAFDSP